MGGNERLDLLVLDGPGRVRELGPGSLIAVSPDGTKAFVDDTATRPQVRVLDLATGVEVARLDLDATGTQVDWLLYAGDWQGDSIVASAGPGLALFRFTGGTLRLAHVIAVDPDRYRQGVLEPRFTTADQGEVVGWAPLGDPDSDETAPTVALRCTLDGHCAAGRPHPQRSVHPISNPSRPLAR
ncbi:hypothetical protein AB0I60_21665 [Actinosynnema sp. NPDC050436]|uniref:hypothetical protein n=1 Tax=Actinosynnema sp. NPDC050436 TaxID=3155659 RepID=UPI0033CA3C5D